MVENALESLLDRLADGRHNAYLVTFKAPKQRPVFGAEEAKGAVCTCRNKVFVRRECKTGNISCK